MWPKTAHHTGGTRHANNGTRTGLFHMAASVLHAVEDAIDHDVDGELPFFRRRCRHGSQGTNDAGTVEHDIDLSKLRYRRLNQRLHLGFVSHIAAPKNGMTRATECRCQTPARLVLNVAQYHPGTVIDVSLCRGRTNAAGGARNDGDFAFQTLAHLRS